MSTRSKDQSLIKLKLCYRLALKYFLVNLDVVESQVLREYLSRKKKIQCVH